MFYQNKKSISIFTSRISIWIFPIVIYLLAPIYSPLLAQDLPQPRGIAVEADGNILVTDVDINTLYRIDRGTGEFTVLSDDNTGMGPLFFSLSDVEVETDGNILVNSFFGGIIYRVDPNSGDRSIVSDETTGSGTKFKNCAGIALDADGFILITDSNNNRVFRVDPLSGDRTIIADFYNGSGPGILLPYGIAVEPDGNIIIANSLTTILRINPVTGERTIVSDANTGSGPEMDRPFGVATDTNGFIYFTDKDIDAVFQIDPITGDRTILSTCPSVDPAISDLLYIAAEADGNLVVVDSDIDEIFRVNSSNGDCTYVSPIGSPIKELNIAELKQIQNFPNPFSTTTLINYEAPTTGKAQVFVLNMLGQPVRELANEFILRGEQSIQWDGRNNAGQLLPSGTYILQINGKKYKGTHKIVMIN